MSLKPDFLLNRVWIEQLGAPQNAAEISAAVIQNDCVHRPQYSPWVAAVFVKPEMRHRGIASAMLQEAAAIARRADVKGLYIDCLGVTAPVYEKNGWKVHEREVGDKDSVVMLRPIK